LGIWGRIKAFFFEKKKQKTFAKGRSLAGGVRQGKKVFWFFFSEKNIFLPVKCLLITYHSTTGGTRAMAEAAHAAAAQEPGVSVTLRHAAATTAEHLLAADGYLFATPETLAAIAGPMKDFFDRTYYAALGRIEGRPYAALICAGSDGQNAARQIARIATGWRLRKVAEPIIVCTQAQMPEAILAQKTISPDDLARCADLGAALAAGLKMGIF
jgi:flavodoxin